jgi:GNAT superfamily N-acetyltransferase
MIVREYQPADRSAVREISYATSLEGRAHDFLDAREAVEDALTVYFTDHAPGSCFVAEESGKVIGYLLGAHDVGVMEKVMALNILPRIFRDIVVQGIIFRRKNLLFLWNYCLGFCRGEFIHARLDYQFPAIFHLNILDGFRGKGIGTALVKRNLAFLRGQGTRGVHIGTMSEQAKELFLKLGFQVLYGSRRGYLKYVLGHDTPYYILGKRLKDDH